MCRLFAVLTFITFVSATACAYAAATSVERVEIPQIEIPQIEIPQLCATDDSFGLGDITFAGASVLKWPDKKVSLDVKDASIRRLAELLSAKTGIRFIVKEGVPADLKITIHVSGMSVKQFLDTLSAATGLTYTAESRTEAGEKVESPSDAARPKTTVTGESISIRQKDEGEVEVTTSDGSVLRVVTVGSNAAKPVTHVIISSLAAEGVIVNLGRVSLSLKDADPIEAVTKILDQADASYVLMDLKDYLALQDIDRAAEIEKAVREVSRPRITLALRDVPVINALARLAEKGQFYITILTASSGAVFQSRPPYLIVPDVRVTNPSLLPGLSPDRSGTTFVRKRQAQEICMGYMEDLAEAVLKYAAEHDGVLPDGATWIQEIPVRNEHLARTNPRYQYAYAMNRALSGKKLTDIADPSETVLLFECNQSISQGTELDLTRNWRHPDGRVYAFVDGRIEIRKDIPRFNP